MIRRDGKMTKYRYALSAALLMTLLALQGCATGKQLQTAITDLKTITGSYDLYLYGCRYPADYEHAAFLISPDAKYPVELFVHDKYEIKKGLQADKALSEAYAFVRCGNHVVEDVRVLRIPDDSGGTIGYEVLPRYPFTDLSGADPLLVSYSLKEGKVIVYIRISPEVERKLNSVGGPGSGGM
jgi:hypothetical protein